VVTSNEPSLQLLKLQIWNTETKVKNNTMFVSAPQVYQHISREEVRQSFAIQIEQKTSPLSQPISSVHLNISQLFGLHTQLVKLDDKTLHLPLEILGQKKMIAILFTSYDAVESDNYLAHLKKFYNHVQTRFGSSFFEIVQVPLDMAVDHFIDGVECNKVPWYCVPYRDRKLICDLVDRFNVSNREALPVFYINNLDKSNNATRKEYMMSPRHDASSKLVTEPDQLVYSWIQQLGISYLHWNQLNWNLIKYKKSSSPDTAQERTLKRLFPSNLTNSTGVKYFMLERLKNKRVVGVLYSASWVTNYSEFTSSLVSFYKRVRKLFGEDSLEIVLFDQEVHEKGMFEYMRSKNMPWLAIPFTATKHKESLSKLLNTEGIPKLYLIRGDKYALGCDALHQKRLNEGVSLYEEWMFE
jgi:hypothetical protein